MSPHYVARCLCIAIQNHLARGGSLADVPALVDELAEVASGFGWERGRT